MNRYRFEEIYIGMKANFEVVVTEDMQKSFETVSGDNNPIHIDDKYAILNGFQGRLVYGMLTASFLSRLVGVYMPGENCLFHQCDVAFPNPVYIGDHLIVCGEVKDIDKQFKRITIKAHIKGKNGKKVLRGQLIVGVREE